MKTSDLRRGDGETGRRGDFSPCRSVALSPRPFTKSSTRSAWLVVMIAAFVLGLTGCGYYSFTGATIPERLNTVAIPLAADAGTPFAGISDAFTQELISRFVGQTRLELSDTEAGADAVLTTRISDYETAPVSVSGEGQAQFVRVTLTVEARYYDQVEDQELLASSFSGYAEYDPVEAGPNGARVAAVAALEDVAEQIFNAATSNW